jgi:hypothetical protein
MPKIQLSDLKSGYEEWNSCDQEIFAEQRSNILLMASEHYAKKGSKFWSNVRDARELNTEQRVRLTKNHMYKIIRGYASIQGSLAPGVTCLPQNEQELGDVKSAELHEKVRRWASDKYRFREKVRNWLDDFNVIGEVGCFVYYDPTKGKQVGFEQEKDEAGEPVFEEDGVTPKASEKPVFSGDFVFETFFGFNLLRDADAKQMEDSKQLTIRSTAKVSEMKKKYAGDKEKLKAFEDSPDGTYLIFDANKASYGRSKDLCQINRTFYRPCIEYPNGYYVFWTESAIFEEGELPFGKFPVAYAAFDRYQTSPRGRSHIKILRPFQIEINRAASKIAEHQITLGDDKIIMQAGTKIQQGGTLPGVRGVTVTGASPQILPGRDGSQYYKRMELDIDEMYRASLLAEQASENVAQQDPWALVHRAASQKTKFKLYVERFEQFLVDTWDIFFTLARQYLSDEDLMEIMGPDEQMNWDEFRDPSHIGYKIQLEPMSDDVDSQFAQQMTMNQLMQFAGSKMSEENIGRIIETMPFARTKDAFKDMTQNSRLGTNMILALDKGKKPRVHPKDDHQYMIKRLSLRMREPDYDFLPPQVQANYEEVLQFHMNFLAQIEQQLAAAQKDFIPTTGAMVGVDLYVPHPDGPEKAPRRARVPYDAIQWLITRIEQQGSTLAELEGMNQYNLAQIAQTAGLGQDTVAQPTGAPPQQVGGMA